MDDKLFPIEEQALKSGDKELMLAILSSYQTFTPSPTFLKNVYENFHDDEKLMEALFVRNLDNEEFNIIFEELARRKDVKNIFILFKHSFYLELQAVKILLKLNHPEVTDIYFKEWFPIIHNNQNAHKVVATYLKKQRLYNKFVKRYC